MGAEVFPCWNFAVEIRRGTVRYTDLAIDRSAENQDNV